MLVASVGTGASPLPEVALIATSGLVLIAGRAMKSAGWLIVPLVTLLAAIVVTARSKTGILSIAPLSGPLRYTNADGAFYLQAAIAGLMLAVRRGQWAVRVVGGLGAAVFAVLPFAIHADAAAWLVVVLPSIALASAGIAGARGARAGVALMGALFAAALGLTIAVGGTYSPGLGLTPAQRAAISVVGPERVVLWREAFVIMRAHPVAGVGPQRFQVVSPTARRNADYRWAHDEFLQQGAEGGVVGLALLAGLFVWGFARLWIVRAPGALTALAGASLAALGIHACIDYVMHFPAVPLMTAGLVGIGMLEGWNRT